MAEDSLHTRRGDGQRQIVAAVPAMRPAPDEPGTLAEQMLAIMDWLSQPDDERVSRDSWERSRRRWISHARRGRE